MAVASGGGHWVELCRVISAFDGHDVVYVTTLPEYQKDVGDAKFYAVPDATRWNKLGLLRTAVRLLGIMFRERPDVVISTGAAPGYFSMKFAKWMGARTVWLDSIANAECLSMAGEKVGRYADLWLTQWPHLARPEGPYYRGAVL